MLRKVQQQGWKLSQMWGPPSVGTSIISHRRKLFCSLWLCCILANESTTMQILQKKYIKKFSVSPRRLCLWLCLAGPANSAQTQTFPHFFLWSVPIPEEGRGTRQTRLDFTATNGTSELYIYVKDIQHLTTCQILIPFRTSSSMPFASHHTMSTHSVFS